MLAVLTRYRLFLILLSLILLIVLLWLFIAGQDRDKTPSRGVFVIESRLTEGRCIRCSR